MPLLALDFIAFTSFVWILLRFRSFVDAASVGVFVKFVVNPFLLVLLM